MVAVMRLTSFASPSLDVSPLGETSLAIFTEKIDNFIAIGLVVCYEYRFHIVMDLFVCVALLLTGGEHAVNSRNQD